MKRTVLGLLAVGMLIPCGAWAQEDEDAPGRGVARVSLIDGDVSVRRGDSGDWVAAALNAPLEAYDNVVTGAGSRAEIQFDYGTFLRMSSDAEVRFSQLEDRRYQLQLARGAVTLRILRDVDSETEIDTPNISARPVKRGTYRIAVREDGLTEVTVRSGEAEVFTPRGTERLRSGQTMLVRGTASDPEFQVVHEVALDDWDRWNEERDHRLERSQSYRYVSRDIYGADDLDSYGRWTNVAPYGMVWIPGGVDAGWAPYRYGRWAWVDYYGWSWVSYDPWGWAPYHYGRWFHEGGYGWCWFPGPVYQRHFWRPGLVAFFGFGAGSGMGFGFGNIGWVPLAPYEPYYPWYGHRWYGGYRNTTYVNNGVHIVNNTNITNTYRNARTVNGVTGVDAGSFNRGVAGGPVQASQYAARAALMRGPVPVTPIADSQRFSNREVRITPPRSTAADQRFATHRAPVRIERVPFEQQQRGMEQYVRRTLGDQAVQAQTGRMPQNAPPTGSVAGGAARLPGATPGRDSDAAGSVVTGAPRPPTATAGRGEPVRTDSRVVRLPAGGQQTQPGSAPPSGWRPVQQGEQQRGNADSNGRRLGDGGDRQQQGPVVRTEQTPATLTPQHQAPPARVQDTERGRSSEGWRQFGGPARTPETTAPARKEEVRQPARREEAPAPARVERTPDARPKDDFAPRSSGRTDWQTFPSAPQVQSAMSSEPVRINPPIVQARSEARSSAPARSERPAPARVERSAPAPRTQSRSSSGGGSRSEGGRGRSR